MFAQRLWTAALIALGCWLPSAALAQSGTAGTGSTSAGGVRVELLSIGGETVNALGQIYLSKPDCEGNVALVFRFDGAPSDKPSIDILVGDSCSGTDRKSSTSNACTYLTSVASGGITQGLMVTLHATDLIKDCNAAVEEMPKLWFLWVNTTNGTEAVGSNYAEFDRLGVDTLPPSAPSSLASGKGESEVPISWKSGQTHLKGFVVFIDTSGMAAPPLDTGGAGSGSGGADAGNADAGDAGGAGDGGTDAGTDAGTRVSVGDGGTAGDSSGACGPTQLMGGETAENVPNGVRVKMIDEPTATGTSLKPSDLGGATEATIAVAAVDLAGNQGALSNLSCVQFVQTSGFLDQYRANGGTAKAGCPCSAMGPADLTSAWPVALAVWMLGLSRRRRRRS